MTSANEVVSRDFAGASYGMLAGRYRLLRQLSSGSSGQVLLVEDLRSGAACALKVLTTELPASLMRAEFARLSGLEHPNVVRVLDAGVLSDGPRAGRPFLVTAFVDGPSLGQLLGTVAESDRYAVFADAAYALADAIAYLHAQGILHGDVSPSNIRCDHRGLPILIDFGLASRIGAPRAKARVSGTLGFIAPEALLGEIGPAKDLFALGATLYDAWTGAPPFGLGADAIRRMWQGPPAAPSTLYPGLPQSWDRMLLQLLAPTPEERPASARDLLTAFRAEMPDRPATAESSLATPFPAGDPVAGLVVGRGDELAILQKYLGQLAEGACTASVICLVGGPGSGRRTLIARALRDARLAILAQTWQSLAIEQTNTVELLSREQSDWTTSIPSFDEPTARSQQVYGNLARRLEERSGQRPLCVALSGSLEDEALAQAVAAAAMPGRLLLLLPCERSIEGTGIVDVRLPPLSRKAIVELATHGAGSPPPSRIVDEIVAGSNGMAAAATLLVRRWIARIRGDLPAQGPLIDGDCVDFARLLDESFAALSAETRALVLALALANEPLDLLENVPLSVRAEAERTGWLLPSPSALTPSNEGPSAGPSDPPRMSAAGPSPSALTRVPIPIPSEAHLSAVWRAVATDTSLHAAAYAAAIVLPEGDVRRAEVLLSLGDAGRAAKEFGQAMRAAVASMAWSQAAAYGLRAVAADDSVLDDADRVALVTALGILGRYDDALALFERAGREHMSDLSAIERKAWLLGRRGESAAARTLLEQALVDFAKDERIGVLRARLARMMVANGNVAEALALVEPLLTSSSDTGTAARETAVLALAHMGRATDARHLIAPLTAQATESGDCVLMGRVSALAGLVEQLDGHPAAAAACYASAATSCEQVQELHGFAAASFNLGCTLAEIGDYGRALTALERAIRELGRLGALSDHALAVFNVGQLFLQLADVNASAKAAEELERAAVVVKLDSLTAYATLLRAEVERKRCSAEADRHYKAAREALRTAGLETVAVIAAVEHAEFLAERGDIQWARSTLAECVPADETIATTAPLAELTNAARARVALRDTTTAREELATIADAITDCAHRAKVGGRLPAAWRLSSLAAQLWGRLGDSRAVGEAESARSCFSEVKMKTPAKYWPGMEADIDARVLRLATTEAPASDGRAERAALLENHLRRLLRINKRLNSDLRLSRVLETIIDTVIELTDAERGFLLLKDGNGELTVKVARNMDQTSLEGSSSSLSRSIAKQAAESGEPVIAVDAAGDSRFAEHLSVNDLHLRSVLAVPLTVKSNVVGTIYVDHRLRKGVFGEDELAMVLDFAEQGAIAIENTRVIAELRRREQQVESLNRRLERQLKTQAAALSDVRIELMETRQAAALRYDYRQIVGQSPCMVELFRLLDRVTDTVLPVVIEGESGTGKELVARAIHFNGSRKERPFVSENCAAIPESLLESALFGHIRGSFTGADRDARGLFAIADGGTLFLDEVAEMSPAMQGKLLRVLQDGQFHRVGAERPEKANVRVVVATNRNLEAMVEAGKFRKDLFYRLSVLRLHLPPLRERREDVPLLVRHFLKRAAEQSGTVSKAIDPTALAKLSRYPWPGNVRELENEIARAGAFASEGITVADLSPHIQTGQDPSESIGNEPDSLRVRHRVERLERQLIREALSRSQGNQTRAAAMLGLSRFGLQKKLRRYNLGT